MGRYLNQYDVIKIDMQTFMTKTNDVTEMLQRLTSFIVKELENQYQEISFQYKDDLSECMADVFYEAGRQFVVLIDEWDCVMRRYHNSEEQRKYLDFRDAKEWYDEFS